MTEDVILKASLPTCLFCLCCFQLKWVGNVDFSACRCWVRVLRKLLEIATDIMRDLDDSSQKVVPSSYASIRYHIRKVGFFFCFVCLFLAEKFRKLSLNREQRHEQKLLVSWEGELLRTWKPGGDLEGKIRMGKVLCPCSRSGRTGNCLRELQPRFLASSRLLLSLKAFDFIKSNS